MKYLRRILIIFVLIVYNEFFNLLAIKDIYIGPLTLWDVVSLLVVSYLFLEFFVGKMNYKNIENRKAIIWINWLIVFIFIVTLSMPFRGETLGNAFMISRKVVFPYLMVHLFVIDIIKTQSTAFLEKLLIYFSVIFSVVFILRLLIPDVFINQLGFAYVTAALILLYWKDYFQENHKIDKLIILILFIGVFAQPFRAYAFATVGLLIGSTFLFGKFKKILKYILIIVILIVIAVPVSDSFGKYSISNQVDTLIYDFTVGGKDSSTGARMLKDIQYRIPMIIDSPWLGYGYVHPQGNYAKQLGFYIDDKSGVDAYNLFSVDSGYLTFLTTFGFIGTLIILLILIKIAVLTYKCKIYQLYKYSFLTLLLVFIPVTYTHHPLMTDFGIIPLMMLLALTTKSKSMGDAKI